jgi:Kelch motif/Galactose oxidase, central domain
LRIFTQALFGRSPRALAPVAFALAGAAAAALVACTSPAIQEAPVRYTNIAGRRVPELTMTTPRANAAAVRLQDGRVLICGGTSETGIGGVLASAEIYDPVAHTIAPTGGMQQARMGQTATLLDDGRVLIAGGAKSIGYRSELASAEIYDPASGTFSLRASMSTPREGHTATLLRDGRVLVAGGSANGVRTLDSAEIYDPSSNRWKPTASMTVPREAHTATRMRSSKVLMAGGGRGGMPGGYIAYQNAEVYDPSTERFTAVAARMKMDRVGAVAALLDDGRVLIVGGKSAKLLTARFSHILASFPPLETAEFYDPELQRFAAAPPMSRPHYLATATLLQDGGVLVVGGWRMQGVVIIGMKEAELFDPLADRWAEVGPLHTARLLNTATLLDDGEVMIAGGIDSHSRVTDSIEFYDPVSRRFMRRAAPPPGSP